MRKPATRKAVRSKAVRRKPARRKTAAKKPTAPRPPAATTITPYLTVRGADQAIAFYKTAFGAREVMRMPGPDGTSIMHAALRIGASTVFLSDELPGMGCRAPQSLGGTTASLHLEVPNVDRAFARAVAAGAEVKMPVADMFWGDRYGKVADPFGHEWGMATPKEQLTSPQIRKRAAAFFAQAGQ